MGMPAGCARALLGFLIERFAPLPSSLMPLSDAFFKFMAV
jgi:hypothetical protein